jgi:CRP/FNR family transcriptional regulator
MKPSGDLQITVQLLKSSFYFSSLDDEAIDLLARAAVRRVYSSGQVVLLEGEPCTGLSILESGWLKAVKIGLDGREQVLQNLGPGEVFNAISVFTDVPNQATVIALETSVVWHVQRETLLALLERRPDLARQVIRDLAGRIVHLVRMVEDLSLCTVEARLARLILAQAQGDAAPRRRWATQAELAARLGTVPDVIQRALRKLADDGLIVVERQQIRLLDRDGLKEVAQLVD